MKLTFTNIKINNFMSFADVELDLNRTGYYTIKGVNNSEGDSASSNGSGKSTLFEALCWVLTGETVRGTKDVSNIYTDKGACVELDFRVDNNEYKLIRKKDPSALQLLVNGEDKSGKGIRDTEKILTQYLPDLSGNLIGSVVILGQGLPQRFTNNSPSGRKEILETLSKSDFMVYDLKTRISERKNELNKKLRECEDNLLLTTNNAKNAETLISQTEAKINAMEPADSLQRQVMERSNTLTVLEEKKKEVESLIAENTSSMGLYTSKLKDIDDEIRLKLSALENDYLPDIEEVKSRINKVSNTISILQSEIRNINNIKDVCPTCGQKLEGVVKPSTKEQEEKVACYTEQVNDLKRDLEVYTNEYQKKKTEIENEQGGLKTECLTQYNLLNAELTANNADSVALDREISRCKELINDYNTALKVRESQLKSYEEIVSANREILNKCNNELLYINKEREELMKRVEVINKIFSAINKEFRGYLLTNIIQYIDKVAKEYCRQVFNNTLLNFELKGNNISISYSDKEYENLSGGEKQKVDIIIQFAIRNMLSKYLNFSSNILVLDEVTDFLDNQGVDAVLNLITNNLKDVPAIYFITHHDNLMFPYDGEITVVKNREGISSVYDIS